MKRVLACPVCATSRGIVVRRADESHRERFLAFSARKYGGLLDDWIDHLELAVGICPACGHAWYRDQPSDDQLAAMYEAGRPLLAAAVPRESNPWTVAEMRRLRRVVVEPRPTLLDYGSGFGRWARAAVEAGFQVWAYEPSAVRGREEAPPFRLVGGKAELAGLRFTAINVEQVLEHVPDPVATLSELRQWCSEATIVRITVPNILRPLEGRNLWTSWPFDGERPHTLAPFEHLHGFTPTSLRLAFRRAGFEWIAMSRLAREYPLLVVRRGVATVWPRAGQTLALVRPTP